LIQPIDPIVGPLAEQYGGAPTGSKMTAETSHNLGLGGANSRQM